MSKAWIWVQVALQGAQNAFDSAFSTSNGTTRDSTQLKVDTPFKTAYSLVLGLAPLLTLLGGVIASYLLNYVLFELIFTLAAVDTPLPGGPETGKYSILDSVEAEARSKKSDDPVRLSRRSNYTVTGLRSGLRQLQAEAGDFSFFRGMGTNLAVNILFALVAPCVDLGLHYPTKWLGVGRFHLDITGAVVALLFAQANTAWVHIVISKPKHRFWFRRLPLTFLVVIQSLWIPILARFCMGELIDCVPSLFSLTKTATPQHHQPSQPGKPNVIQLADGPIVSIPILSLLWLFVRFALRSLVTPLLTTIFATPIDVIYRRMQASSLPDYDDPIIPFDRSFTNSPQNSILHQQQTQTPINLLRAIRSLDKSTVIRLGKITLKFHLVVELLTYLFWSLIFLEITALVGIGPIWVCTKAFLDVPVVQQDLNAVSVDARGILEHLFANATAAAAAINVNVVAAATNATMTIASTASLATVSLIV